MRISQSETEISVSIVVADIFNDLFEALHVCRILAVFYPFSDQVTENAAEEGFLSACAFSGRDDMQITVTGNDDRLLLVARFDNLGKGASGAAIQNMNILLGVDETTGLQIGG